MQSHPMTSEAEIWTIYHSHSVREAYWDLGCSSNLIGAVSPSHAEFRRNGEAASLGC
jgi:hypothetical protein